jgi:splicing factor 3A subunit 1
VLGIIETTAAYVARSGPHFEDRIRENEKQNPRFCFLNPTDPYRAYYDFKISEARGEGIMDIFCSYSVSQSCPKDHWKSS